MVASFVILYISEREDEDFLELPYDVKAQNLSTRIVRFQIWIYVILNVWLACVIKDMVYDHDQSDAEITFAFVLLGFWFVFGAFIPVILIALIRCMSGCGKQSSPSVEID